MLCIDMRSLGVLDISDSVSRLCPAQVSLHWYWYIDAPSSEQFCLRGNYLPTSISGDEDQPSSEYLASKAQSPSASAKIFSDRFDVLISVSGPRVTSPCTANILNMTNDQLHKMESIRITRAAQNTLPHSSLFQPGSEVYNSGAEQQMWRWRIVSLFVFGSN